jgi:hypothetical protein
MKVFRLVLCLAGLAVYLIVRPAVETSSLPHAPAPAAAQNGRTFTVEPSPDSITSKAPLPEKGLVAGKPSR